MERSKSIFGNELSTKDYKKALRTQKKSLRKFGDDRNRTYHLKEAPTPAIGQALGVRSLLPSAAPLGKLGGKSVIVGSIRMGFGHYRISMAMASAARSMGYEPYWMDLCSYDDTSCGKIISHQNDLYSLGSRISQRSKLFNSLVWEPMNSEGFRKLSYNAADQKNSELMTAVFGDLDKDTPFIATHAWTAQAALHAGMTHVVNAIPDNWQMALHLAEGAIHTIQTPSAFLGYKTLHGMDKKRVLRPMPDGSLVYTGHYVDHELVAGIDEDCAARRKRLANNEPLRCLLSVGGAGAQENLFLGIIEQLIPHIRSGRASLFLSVGDHIEMWESLSAKVKGLKELSTLHFNNFAETSAFADAAREQSVYGVHVFGDSDIFGAVYATNLLMRASDILITKPSELSFYPIPKLMIHRVGGHEAWGAIRSAEVGDGTYECQTLPEILAMLDLMLTDGEVLDNMCAHILTARDAGIYNGAYRAVELAVNGIEKQRA